MIEKFKQFINEHYGYIPILIILGLWIIIIPFVFLFGYKKPINLTNEDDKIAITEMIKEQQKGVDIKDIILVKNTIYPKYSDSISNLIGCSNDDEVIMWHTDNVDYNIIIEDSIVESWTTIFEVEYKLLRQKVGKHLITFKK